MSYTTLFFHFILVTQVYKHFLVTTLLLFSSTVSEFKEDTIAKSRPIRPFGSSVIENSSLRPDIGPAIRYDVRPKPPQAGPYAFSRIPKSRLKFPRIYFSSMKDVPVSTWIFGNTSTGYTFSLPSSATYFAFPQSLLWSASGIENWHRRIPIPPSSFRTCSNHLWIWNSRVWWW